VKPDAVVGALLDSALAGVLIQHREACCSVLSFLVGCVRARPCARVNVCVCACECVCAYVFACVSMCACVT
jgi:hypothetical protein